MCLTDSILLDGQFTRLTPHYLMPGGNKRSYVLTYDLLLLPGIKGLNTDKF